MRRPYFWIYDQFSSWKYLTLQFDGIYILHAWNKNDGSNYFVYILWNSKNRFVSFGNWSYHPTLYLYFVLHLSRPDQPLFLPATSSRSCCHLPVFKDPSSWSLCSQCSDSFFYMLQQSSIKKVMHFSWTRFPIHLKNWWRHS